MFLNNILIAIETIGEIKIENTPKWTWTDTEVKVENGKYPIYFIYYGEGIIDIKDIRFN